VTLFSMAFRNLRRNFNNYLIYFVSMVFSIMIYHVFTSIQYNEQVANLTEIKSSIFVTFKASSIIIAIFACIFIWYSNSFFTKRRKKEVDWIDFWILAKFNHIQTYITQYDKKVFL
jgi:putative ABC transport system permease protein